MDEQNEQPEAAVTGAPALTLTEQPAKAAPVTEETAAAASGDAHWQKKMERLRKRQLPEQDLLIYLDQDAQRRESIVRAALISARADGDDTDEKREAIKAAEEEHERAKAELEGSTVRLRFRGLPRPVYEAMLDDHKPTDEQERMGESYNPETFAPALIAACSIDGMTVEEAKELLATWNQSEAGALFQTAISVNQQSRMGFDLGKG